MYKLLTDEEKKIVAKAYAERRAVVMLSACIFILVVALIGLLPTYILTTWRQDEVVLRAKTMIELGQTGNDEGLQNWLSKVKRELQVLSPKFDTDRPSQFIKMVVDERVSGVRLNAFSWVKVKNKVTLSISGVAVDRQALIAFEDDIQASRNFSGVTLPISDLARDKNISFQIKFTPAGTATTTPIDTP